ncbi:Kinetochore protein NDC80-like protein [Microtus ochrogaster]|uniref:Kinetochore protein NDC80 n=1 Tax=Microtus ochrogaster TaxID=79684 RepID=A0A8J6FXP9_MICOH|nr:Kinetochore protein NDC80-like protein [Microtus ochrogaster]
MKRSSVSTGGAGCLSTQELRSQDLDKAELYTPQTYPFALSKSSLYAVGAPHTWPHIVAALVWLIDCIKNCLESLKKLKASLQSDVEKYKAYLSSLESHSSILDEKLSGLDEEISSLELQCETMREENARLQNIVDNQNYSVADIERINHEKNELQQTINKLTKDLETEQQQMWNEELKYARGKEAAEAQDEKCARELESLEKHKHLLESAVNKGLSEAMDELEAVQREDGHPLTDDEIAGMLIRRLLAVQHTSSTTRTWMGFLSARDKPLQGKRYPEQKAVCGEGPTPLTYEQVCVQFEAFCSL